VCNDRKEEKKSGGDGSKQRKKRMLRESYGPRAKSKMERGSLALTFTIRSSAKGRGANSMVSS